MEKSPTRSTDTFGKNSIVDMGDFSTANSVNMSEEKKNNFFAKLFTLGCFTTPDTFNSLSTHSPCSSLDRSVEKVFGNVFVDESVADNFSFFDSKPSE